MRKTHKNILGLFGLVIVVAMTIFAAIIPGPETSATTSGATNSIVVRVLASTADVNITSPSSGTVFAKPEQEITFNYSQVNDLLVTIEKANPSGGSPTVYTLYSDNAGSIPGEKTIPIDFTDPRFGYGEYTIKVSGEDASGVIDNDSVNIQFLPVVATVEKDEDTGDANVILDYDEDSDGIDHFEINVYDEDGNLVEVLSPITVSKPTKEVHLPFSEHNLPGGKYTILVSTFDKNNNLIHKPYSVIFVYEPLNVPNTGSLFGQLNISKNDYLITGLIIFSVTGIFGAMHIAKSKRGIKK